MSSRFLGPLSRLGLVIAFLSIVLDQALKLWALNILGIQETETFPIAPSFDFTLVWNRGISYGLLQQYSELGRWGLIAFRFAAVIFLMTWLARTHRSAGVTAFLLSLPVAFCCLYAYGFAPEPMTARTLTHSVLGCLFYGAFATKVIVVRSHRMPGWALPVVGGVLFVILVLIWFTSSLWFMRNVSTGF